MSVLTATPRTVPSPEDPRAYEAFYHEHEEDSVPGPEDQSAVAAETGEILKVYAPHLSMHRDMCCYWIRENNRRYLAPLWETNGGIAAMVLAGLMVMAGSLLIKRIVEIEV